LSRTFRSMFGIAPSFLFKQGRVSVTFLDASADTTAIRSAVGRQSDEIQHYITANTRQAPAVMGSCEQ
jgi:hypothetical protein